MGTTNDFTNSFLHLLFVLYCFLGLGELQAYPFPDVVFQPLSLSVLSSVPFIVPFKMVLAKPYQRKTCQHRFSLRLFMVIRSSCGPIARWILARTFLLVTRSLYEMHNILQKPHMSIARIVLCSSAVKVHDSPSYRKMDVTRKRISRILELREMPLSFQTNIVSTIFTTGEVTVLIYYCLDKIL